MSLNTSEEDSQLFACIDKNDINLLKRLLSNKQNVNILDENSMTPLQHAAYKGNKEMVQMLLDQGADVNLCQHHHGYSALHFAGLSGNGEVCSMLLLAGAKPHVINSVNRTPSQMAGFVGNHNCVAIINNFIPKSDIEYYTVIRGQQTKPTLPPFIADSVHKFIMQVNVHPVKIALGLQRYVGLLDHVDELANVLELMCNKEMKQGPEMNEVMAFKFHYLSTVCKEIAKQFKSRTVSGEANESKTDIIEVFIKKMLKVNKEGQLYLMDAFLKDCVRSFPFHESTLFRQMVTGLTSDSPIPALSVITTAINGQRAFADNISICSTCCEEKPEKKCAKCKVIRYCDRECQKLHWFVHKRFCDRLGQAKEDISQNKKVDSKEISEELHSLLLSS